MRGSSKVLVACAFALAACNSEPAPVGSATQKQSTAIKLDQIAVGFDNPIGVDHHQPSNKLVLSVNYSSGQPFNFELVGPDGSETQFSTVSGLSDEVYIATARDSTGGFTPGELFVGTGVPGAIARVSPDGSSIINPWVQLPGETGLLRGGLRVDRTGLVGGDLLVVTTRCAVWRVSSAGVPTLLAVVGPLCEGITAVPNDPIKYGPWAGKILTGSETTGALYAVGLDGSVTTWRLPGINEPENLAIVPPNENFYGVDFASRILWGADSSQFLPYVGDIALGEEFPGNLWIVHWNGTQFTTTLVATVGQFEGANFSPAITPGLTHPAQSCPTPPGSTGPQPTLINYQGPNAGEYNDPLAVAAQLTDGNRVPLTGRTLRFQLGAQVALAPTDAQGVAHATLVPSAVGPTPLSISFAGETGYSPSSQSVSVAIAKDETAIKYTGPTLVAAGGPQAVSAILFDPDGGAPLGGRTLTFTLGSQSAAAVTDGSGAATATITLGASAPTGPGSLTVAFAGDANLLPSTTTAPVTVFVPEPFVVWGANPGGLQLGQHVQFWGAQWWKQVTAGDYGAQGAFKGFAETLAAFAPCEATRSTATTPPLDSACWTSKSGNSFPPSTLPQYIGLIVSTSIEKSGATISGNIAATVACRVDSPSTYANDPGHPGFCTVVGVIADGTGTFPKPTALSLAQTQPPQVLPGQPFAVTATISNTSAVAAQQVALAESNINEAPATASAAVGALAAGASATVTINVTAPPVAARGAAESSGAYQSRLAATDGLALVSNGSVTFTDANQVAYVPAVGSSQGQLALPRLAIAVTGVPCVGPGQDAPYTVTVTNVGSAGEQSGALHFIFPDGTSRDVTLPAIAVGANFTTTLDWTVPAIPNLQAGESVAAYLARLATFDGLQLTATARVTWTDARGNSYGAIEQPFVALERVPIVTSVPPAIAPMLPGLTEPIAFELKNEGSGNAASVELALTSPGGATATASKIAELDARGVATGVAVNATAPALAPRSGGETDAQYLARLAAADERTLAFTAAVDWRDASNDPYGPTTSVVTATEIVPILSLQLAGPSAAQSGDLIDYVVTVENLGHAPAVLPVLNITQPDGSTRSLSLTPLGAQSSETATFSFSIPTTLSGAHATTVALGWSDTRGTLYGPVSANAPITITRPNQPPVVDAGPPQTITLPQTATLAGNVTDDGLPSGVLLSSWSVVSGPGSVTFADASQPTTTATFGAPGVYVLQLFATDTALSASANVTITVNQAVNDTLTLSPPAAGPNVTGTQQRLVARLLNQAGSPQAGVAVQFTVVGANPGGGSATTDGTGSATFTYTGTQKGTDSVQATAAVGSVAISSNSSTVSWVTPVETVSTTTVFGRFFFSDGSGPFDTLTTATPAFTENFPTVNFNPPSGTVPGNTSGVNENTRPFTDITTDLNGNFTGTIVAQGNGQQAGVGSMFAYQVVLTGNFTVAAAATVTYNFYSDDGFIFGVNGGATRVSGPLLNAPPSTPFQGYPVMGAFNTATAPVGNSITVHYPAAGVYPFEIDYSECCGGQLALTMAASSAGNTGVPPTGALTLSPTSFAAQSVGVPVSFQVKASDASGAALTNQFVVVSVTGANPQQIFGATDATGVAHFSYTATHTGSDSLQASGSLSGMGAYSNQVSLQWNALTRLPPQVSAGPSQTIQLPVNNAALAGSVVDTGTPTIAWSQVSGPAGVTFANPSSPSTTANFPGPGTYDLKLTASDVPYTASADVTITVLAQVQPPNHAPVVSAGPNLTVTLPSAGALIGSVSDDGLPTGGALTVHWTQVNGPAPVTFTQPNNPQTSAIFPTAGTYVVQLAASDSQLSSTAQATVNVTLGTSTTPQPPIISAGTNLTVTLPNPATLNGQVTDNSPPGTPLTIQWSEVSGPGTVTFADASSAFTTVTFSAPGNYVLQLSANNTFFISTSTISVTVNPAAAQLTVSAGNNQTITLPASAQLHGSVTDSTGTPTIAWSKVSGAGTVTFADASAAATTASFTAPGIYVLELTATDGARSQSASVSIAVNGATNHAPLVDAGPDQTIAMPGSTTLPGTVTDDGLPTGALTIGWSEVSGPGAVTFGSPAQPTTSATFPKPGTYVLRLTASDGQLTTTADVVVSGRPGVATFAPVIYSTPTTTAQTGTVYNYPVLAEDRNGDALSFSLTQAPPGMLIDPASGLASWTPGPGDVGNQNVTVHVTDPTGLFAEQPYVIAVAHGSAPPHITTAPPLSGTAGATYVYAAAASDPDDTSFTWSVAGPSGMNVDGNGRVTWLVPSGTNGTFAVTLTVADPAGHRAQQAFSVGVAAGTNPAPIAAITSPAENAVVGQPVDIIGTASSPVMAGYTLQLCRSWGALPGCQTLSSGLRPVVNGKLATLDPRTLPDGSWQVQLVVSDATGHQTIAPLDVALKTGNRKLGAMRLDFPEFDIHTKTATLSVHRVYDGLDLTPGPLGIGWKFEWDVGHNERLHTLEDGWEVDLDTSGFIPTFVVVPTADHPLNFVLDDGRQYQFKCFLTGDGALSSVHSAVPSFPELTSTGATLTALDSNFYPYSTTSYDEIVIDDTVFESDFATPWEPAYYQLNTEFNEQIIFQANGSVVAFSDGSGFKFERTPTGIALNGTDVLELLNGTDGLIGSATNLLDHATVTYQRDANGNLTLATLADGTTQTFTYVGSRLSGYQTSGLGPERFEYDDQGRVILHVSPSGSTVRTTWDDANNQMITTDPAGNTVITQYNADGNAIKITDPLGHIFQYQYAPGTDHEISRTDPLNHTWQAQFDARGRRTVVINPMHEQTTLTYDDVTGRVFKASDGEGRTYQEQLDTNNRTTGFMLPDGTVARRFAYPDDHTMVSTDARGNVTTNTYDDRGRTLASTTAHGTTSRVYDDVAHTVTYTDPDGSHATASLDRAGRMVRLDSGSSGVFQYTYGATAIVDRVTRPDGGKIEYQKDSGGQLAAVVVDGVPTQTIRKDALGRVASVEQNGSSRSYRYDAAGHVTQIATPEGSSSMTYDAASRVTNVTDDRGRSLTYAYDDANRPTGIQDGSGQSLFIGYDKSGKISSAGDGLGRSYNVGYDANGQRNSISYPGGLAASWTNLPSDDLGTRPPISSLTDLDGVTWSYGYDENERYASIGDALGHHTTYTRNGFGLVTLLSDAAGRPTQFGFSDSTLTSVTSPAGRVEQFAHDGAGRVSAWTRADHSVVNYSYGTSSVTTTLPGGTQFVVEGDDHAGGAVAHGSPGGDVTTWKDSADNVNLVQLDDGAALSASYTVRGLLLSYTATTPSGASYSVNYGYDSGGKLTSIRDPSGGNTIIGYDVQGRPTLVTRPNGTHSELDYTGFDRPSQVRHFSGANEVSVYSYGYDAHGRVTLATTPQGSFQYEYDALSRLSVERQVSGSTIVEEKTRVFDAVGNLSTLTDHNGTTTYSYDDDDRLTQASGPAGTTIYTYNGRGALTEVQAPSGTTQYGYDALDRLTSVTLPGGQVVSYGYDALGRLIARGDASGTRRCLPLPARPVGGLGDCALSYATGASEQAKAQVFGPFGLASTHGPADRYAFGALADSVVALSDGTGTVVGTAAFDPWGALETSGEAGDYGFDGERQDPATGLVWLRARWYDPSTGRFLTPDKFGADSRDPRTLHRYEFALDNPLNRADPTGQQSLAELDVAESIDEILDSIESIIKVCAEQELKGKIFSAVSDWAAQSIVKPALDDLFNTLTQKMFGNNFQSGFDYEADFHNTLADILCGRTGDFADSSPLAGLMDFEWKIKACGEDYVRKSGFAGWADCLDQIATSKGINGIDIVFDGRLGIELKLSAGTFDTSQLKRFCQWGAAKTLHTFFYAFVDFPDADPNDPNNFHRTAAKNCWDCWQGSGCGGPATSFGSIYVAFGAIKNKQGKRFFLPGSQTICGK